MPHQCPECFYFQALAARHIDDSGYEIPGFCGHPRIGMELFRAERRDLSADRCPLFLRRSAAGRDHS